MTSGTTSKSAPSREHWASIRTRKRGDGGESHAVLYWVDGSQRTITYRDRLQADAFCAAIRAHGVNEAFRMNGYSVPDPVGHERTALTVAGWISQHIDSLSGIEQKTRAEYRRYLANDIEPTLGHVPLASLSREDISNWVNRLQATGISGKTIQNKAGFLSGTLNAAVPDRIPANPAAGIRLPRTPKRQMTTLTPSEFQLFKSAFAKRWHPLLDFLVTSGCLFSEAAALTPAAVDRGAGTVRIWQAWKKRRVDTNPAHLRPSAATGLSASPDGYWTTST
jgi:hypothetical protein